MKNAVINTIETHKIIAILRGIPKDKLIPTAEALYEGGVRILEVTFSANGSVSPEETAASVRSLVEHFKGRLCIGAGTVLTEEQVRLTQEAGGLFAISPNTDAEVIAACNQRGLVSIPGALTPTEIAAAHQYGADFVKLFPITSMGPAYVKAVKAPLSHIRLLAVGGIDEHNLSDYLAAGVLGFGIGSNITDKKMIEENDWEGIARLARKYTEGIAHA